MTIREPEGHVEELMREIAAMPRPGREKQRQQAWAPVLAVPRIFEPELCRELIAYYERDGGQPSGFMREREGMTYGMLDDSFKRRRDAGITDKTLREAARRKVIAAWYSSAGVKFRTILIGGLREIARSAARWPGRAYWPSRFHRPVPSVRGRKRFVPELLKPAR